MTIFNSIEKVKAYKKAIGLLDLPETKDRMIWAHDYDTQCYKTDKGYTKNGIHWGYHKGIIASILNTDLDGSGSDMTYARFVGQNKNDDERRSENSRFFKIKYAEIAEIVKKNILEDLKSLKKNAKDDEKIAREWKKEVAVNYAKFSDKTLRIEKTSTKKLKLILINPDRFQMRGFGVFLENIGKNEISISKEALNLLNHGRERSGLNSLEIFSKPIIAGMLSLITELSIDNISVHKGSMLKLKNLLLIE